MNEDLLFSRPRSNHAYNNSMARSFINPSGPINPEGRIVDISDRPLICSSSNMRNEVVIGGSDHALYSIDVNDPRKPPVTMYTKTCGHTDWVSTVAHLSNGQVLSGAMDGKICLWSAQNRRACVDLHRSSIHPISKIVTDTRYDTAISCSYDGNVEIWKIDENITPSANASTALARRSRLGSSSTNPSRPSSISPIKELTGHTSPILECSYLNDRLATGDKSGSMMIWDLVRGVALHRFRAHPGAITQMQSIENGDVVITAGTDGHVKVWDPRTQGSGLVLKVPVYCQPPAPARGPRSAARGPSEQAPAGAPVSVMGVTYSRGSNSDISYIVTGGGNSSDSRLCLIDIRNTGGLVASWDHHRNGVYSLCLIDNEVIFSGDGVGNLLCHHIIPEQLSEPRSCLKYGIGASQAGAVRSIQCLGNKIVTAGEDGKALVFEY